MVDAYAKEVMDVVVKIIYGCSIHGLAFQHLSTTTISNPPWCLHGNHDGVLLTSAS
jgi:hypothetical protein